MGGHQLQATVAVVHARLQVTHVLLNRPMHGPRSNDRPTACMQAHCLCMSCNNTPPLLPAMLVVCCRRRAAHAARNAALNREMSRQQHAFLQGYQRDLAAAFKEQGTAHVPTAVVPACMRTPQHHRSHARWLTWPHAIKTIAHLPQHSFVAVPWHALIVAAIADWLCGCAWVACRPSC